MQLKYRLVAIINMFYLSGRSEGGSSTGSQPTGSATASLAGRQAVDQTTVSHKVRVVLCSILKTQSASIINVGECFNHYYYYHSNGFFSHLLAGQSMCFPKQWGCVPAAPLGFTSMVLCLHLYRQFSQSSKCTTSLLLT